MLFLGSESLFNIARFSNRPSRSRECPEMCVSAQSWPLRHLPDGRGRGAEGIFPGHSTGHCRTAPTAGCDARREAVDHSVFESKRQETCALMAEKVEVCGTDCCKSATPARNDLAVPRFAHDSHCQCGQGSILLLRRHVIWGMSVKTAF